MASLGCHALDAMCPDVTANGALERTWLLTNSEEQTVSL